MCIILGHFITTTFLNKLVKFNDFISTYYYMGIKYLLPVLQMDRQPFSLTGSHC